MAVPTRSFRIPLCVLFCVLGFLGNWFKINLFFNVDFLFGSVFSMLAIITLGGPCGVIVAFAASTCTYLLWNHPWAILDFTLEAIAVSVLYSRRKGNLVIYDMLFWVCVGFPLGYLLYHHVMGMEAQSTLFVMLKQSVNGVFNTLLAVLTFVLFKLVRRPSGLRTAYSELLFVVMVFLALLPTMVVSISAMRTYQESRMETLVSRVSSISETARKNLAGWINEHHNNVQILSTLAGDPNVTPAEEMQHYVELIHAATPAFKSMGIFNLQSVTVSYSPLEQDGKPNLGVDFSDRPHVGIMKREKKPYITDVLMSKLGNPTPIVLLLAPIVIGGEYRGYCSGVIEISKISDLLGTFLEPDVNITLVDGKNRVIVSTLQNLKTMDGFERPYLNRGKPLRFNTLLWRPELKPNTSILQQWRESYLFNSEPVSRNFNWRIVVEASSMPLTDEISRYSLVRLTIVTALIFASVIASYFLSNGFITNIKKLQILTRWLPRKLDDAAHIEWPDSSIEELAELSNNFRQMTSALVEYFTEQKKAEDALLENQSRLETVLAAIPHSVIEYDADLRAVRANAAALKSLKLNSIDFSRDQVLSIFNFRHLDGTEVSRDELPSSRALRGEVVEGDLYSITDADGVKMVICIYAAPLFKEDRVMGVVALWHDLTELKRTESALRESRARLEAALASMADAVFLTDVRGRFIDFNEAFASFHRFRDKAECFRSVPDYYDILDLYTEDGATVPVELWPVNRATRGETATNAEYRLQRRDTGEAWDGSYSFAPIRDKDGVILGAVAVARDVTERKKADKALRDSLDEKVSLLKEVHHRVKNNLQIVASLLGLQSRRSGSRQVVEILQDTSNRVKSMALLHETLYRSGNLALIDFEGYSKDLCGKLLLSSGPIATRVTLDYRVAPVRLPLEQALPCGLIVNELVSNALKHAFPGDRPGRVLIELETLGEKSLVLSVRDDGVGVPPDFDPAASSTLGMQLVHGLASQLNGYLHLEAPQGAGVSVRIEFPIPGGAQIGKVP